MDKIFGYIFNGIFIETGRSEHAAKTQATKNGSQEIGYRSPINNMYIRTARKVKGKWIDG